MMPFPHAAVSRVNVLVIGDIMLDRYWFGEVERISPEAPVPVVRVARCEDRLGGAANVARNIRALGAQVTLLGIVGADEAGAEIRGLAAGFGINTRLIADANLPTTLKLRVLGRQQQLLRVDFEAAPDSATLAQLQEKAAKLVAEHDMLVLSDYAKGALQHVEALIQAAKEAGVPVLVDPKGQEYQRYRGATMITPNRAEMQEATGRWKTEQELEQQAQALRQELGLEALLVTRSEQGMTLFSDQGRQHTDAYAHEVFDVSGAGDTVLATLAVTRAAGLEWFDAVLWANRAGGVVVGKLGTSVVTAKELS
ncbi:D-glycero-beta-D-manno-heptose-7-phosphate kinase [Alcaligenaceae bacterium]|nr:D-glycero-beta-D-manno-heptose-7-phosphate kinase [Alcaligenaceae bacterium]